MCTKQKSTILEQRFHAIKEQKRLILTPKGVKAAPFWHHFGHSFGLLSINLFCITKKIDTEIPPIYQKRNKICQIKVVHQRI